MILDTIMKCTDFFKITCDVHQYKFLDWRTIPKKHRGVYIIANGEDILYVGKGNIRGRQEKHYQKTIGVVNAGLTYPDGWKYLFENYKVPTDVWTVFYITLKTETELSAMEGALIHFLQPLANDETHTDRIKNT